MAVVTTCAVYVGQRASGSWRGDIDNVRHWLGYQRSDIVHGQLWRVFTPNLVHLARFGPGPLGLWHLVSNMVLLAVVSARAERLFGRLGFVVGYVAGGSLANIALVVLNPPSGDYGGGASASIAALFGAVAVLAAIDAPANRHDAVARLVIAAAVVVAGVLTLVQPLMSQPFTRDGHVAGFVAGAALAVVLRRVARGPLAPHQS